MRVCAHDKRDEDRERVFGDDYFSFSSLTLCCCAFANRTQFVIKNNKIYSYSKFHAI